MVHLLSWCLVFQYIYISKLYIFKLYLSLSFTFIGCLHIRFKISFLARFNLTKFHTLIVDSHSSIRISLSKPISSCNFISIDKCNLLTSLDKLYYVVDSGLAHRKQVSAKGLATNGAFILCLRQYSKIITEEWSI